MRTKEAHSLSPSIFLSQRLLHSRSTNQGICLLVSYSHPNQVRTARNASQSKPHIKLTVAIYHLIRSALPSTSTETFAIPIPQHNNVER